VTQPATPRSRRPGKSPTHGEFAVRHLMLATVPARVNDATGTVIVAGKQLGGPLDKYCILF
jgi:hypothetical protein